VSRIQGFVLCFVGFAAGVLCSLFVVAATGGSLKEANEEKRALGEKCVKLVRERDSAAAERDEALRRCRSLASDQAKGKTELADVLKQREAAIVAAKEAIAERDTAKTEQAEAQTAARRAKQIAEATTGNAPVESLTRLVAAFGEKATPIRIANVPGERRFIKLQYRAASLGYDVEKTNSLVSPCMAKVTWYDELYMSPEVASREEAAPLEVSTTPIANKERREMRWTATLALQDGRWVAKNVDWDRDTLRSSRWNVDGSPQPVKEALDWLDLLTSVATDQ